MRKASEWCERLQDGRGEKEEGGGGERDSGRLQATYAIPPDKKKKRKKKAKRMGSWQVYHTTGIGINARLGEGEKHVARTYSHTMEY